MPKIDKFLISLNRVICIATIILMSTIIVWEAKAKAQIRYDDTGTKIALLQQRSDQIDRHLETIDKEAEENREHISALENDFSQIRGGGILLGILLSLFQIVSVVLQIRNKRT